MPGRESGDASSRRLEPDSTPRDEDGAPCTSTSGAASAPSPALVTPPEDQELGHPLGGNPLHALLPPHHVGEGPHRMPFPGGTVTCGLPTPPVRQGQGSRKRILGNPQPPEQCVLPLPEPGRLGTSRSDLHGSDCINTHRFPTFKPPPATAKIGTTSSEAAQCSRREFSRRLL